jgi:acyl-CoA synthetase (AMP-forming)/AMP-acid ligase II
LSSTTLDFESFAAATLDSDPSRIAIRFENDAYSYAELGALIDRHAAALAEHGIGRGDRVGLMILNRPELAALYFACWRLGAIAVPTNVLYRRPEVEYALDHCGARLLIVQDELAPAAVGLGDSIPSMERMYALHDEVEGLDGSWSDTVAATDSNPPEVPLDPDLPAAIFYTSGSTSRPKGVTHTHAAIRAIAETRCESMSYDSGDVWVIGTGLVHVSGSYGTLFPALLIGASAVLLERWSGEAFLEATRRHRPSRALLLPAFAHDVLDHPDAASVDFSSFRSLEVGGDAATEDLYENWASVSKAPLTQILGMTECEGYCLTRPDGEIKQGSSGPPRIGVEVRIVGDDGRVLSANEIGELTLRSQSMLAKYWDDPEHTAAAIRDGWLFTNDLGRIDEDGRIWFAGRKSEMIVRRGSNIAPGEVEDVLEMHPDVLEAVVVGVPDKKFGQRVAAFIEPEGKAEVDDLKAFAEERLAGFKVPEFWSVVDTLPRNAVGKLDRKVLHRMANEEFGHTRVRESGDS